MKNETTSLSHVSTKLLMQVFDTLRAQRSMFLVAARASLAAHGGDIKVACANGLNSLDLDSDHVEGTLLLPLWFKDQVGIVPDAHLTMRDVREELKTRPHIPNKKEARALRQKKMKNHDRRGKRDR
jgi:hypothetical protein